MRAESNARHGWSRKEGRHLRLEAFPLDQVPFVEALDTSRSMEAVFVVPGCADVFFLPLLAQWVDGLMVPSRAGEMWQYSTLVFPSGHLHLSSTPFSSILTPFHLA